MTIIIMIVKVLMKFKIKAVETTLSAYTQHTQAPAHTNYTKYTHTGTRTH